MYPVLFTIPIFGGLKLHTYGLMVALGFLVGIYWVGREARRLGESSKVLTDLCFYIILAAIIGSRLFYVLDQEPDFWRHPLDFFKIWEGGLTFHGGLIGAILVSAWYLIKHHLNFWRIADIFAPGVAIGHAIGRIGCFAAGCCYGKIADNSYWALTFPENPDSLAPTGIGLYPTQLMETLGEGLIFLILVFFRKKKKFDGQVLLLYLILYSILRIIIEIFRGDLARSFIYDHTVSMAQLISGLMVVIAMILWVIRSRTKIRG